MWRVCVFALLLVACAAQPKREFYKADIVANQKSHHTKMFKKLEGNKLMVLRRGQTMEIKTTKAEGMEFTLEYLNNKNKREVYVLKATWAKNGDDGEKATITLPATLPVRRYEFWQGWKGVPRGKEVESTHEATISKLEVVKTDEPTSEYYFAYSADNGKEVNTKKTHLYRLKKGAKQSLSLKIPFKISLRLSLMEKDLFFDDLLGSHYFEDIKSSIQNKVLEYHVGKKKKDHVRLTASVKTYTGRRRMGDAIVLFNPWSKLDKQAYASGVDLEEYVNGANSFIQTGDAELFPYINSKNKFSASSMGYMAFNFKQHVLLPEAMKFIDEHCRLSHHRRNPIDMAECLAYFMRGNGDCSTFTVAKLKKDVGALIGCWDTDVYAKVAKARKDKVWGWEDAFQIFSRVNKFDGPIPYGQCFIFGGALTAISRTLGLASRIVTTYGSACDCNDDHIIEEGKVTTGSCKESIWNFHVWNEVWLKNKIHAYDGTYAIGPVDLDHVRAHNEKAKWAKKFISETNCAIYQGKGWYDPNDKSKSYKHKANRDSSLFNNRRVGSRITTWDPKKGAPKPFPSYNYFDMRKWYAKWKKKYPTRIRTVNDARLYEIWRWRHYQVFATTEILTKKYKLTAYPFPESWFIKPKQSPAFLEARSLAPELPPEREAGMPEEKLSPDDATPVRILQAPGFGMMGWGHDLSLQVLQVEPFAELGGKDVDVEVETTIRPSTNAERVLPKKEPNAKFDGEVKKQKAQEPAPAGDAAAGKTLLKDLASIRQNQKRVVKTLAKGVLVAKPDAEKGNVLATTHLKFSRYRSFKTSFFQFKVRIWNSKTGFERVFQELIHLTMPPVQVSLHVPSSQGKLPPEREASIVPRFAEGKSPVDLTHEEYLAHQRASHPEHRFSDSGLLEAMHAFEVKVHFANPTEAPLKNCILVVDPPGKQSISLPIGTIPKNGDFEKIVEVNAEGDLEGRQVVIAEFHSSSMPEPADGFFVFQAKNGLPVPAQGEREK